MRDLYLQVESDLETEVQRAFLGITTKIRLIQDEVDESNATGRVPCVRELNSDMP
jgi:hypothetical protein